MKYSVVVPKILERGAVVSVTKMTRSDRVIWCNKNIGAEEVYWKLGEFVGNSRTFYFLKEEEDATLFALKWS